MLCHFVRFRKINLQVSSKCFNVDRKFTNNSQFLSENFAFQGIFLIKIQQIYQKKDKICSLKNLKNTFGGRVFCKEHKGIKNARNIAAYYMCIFRVKTLLTQKGGKITFHPTGMLHHLKCCILHADSENIPSGPLGLL